MSPSYLRSLLVTDPLIILFTIVMGSVSLFTSLFDSTGRAQHRVARSWSRLLLWVSRVKVEVEGLEKLDRRKSYVLVANHSSLMDTPLVLAHIPLQFRFFAKKGLFRIPFLGTHLRRAGHLPVVRGDARASLKTMTAGARLLRERGVSILLFPEGGRSPEQMREFKEGAAYIAIKASVPAVPIGISGTREVLPMGSSYIRAGRVRLCIGDPIPTTGMTIHEHKRLTRQLQQLVASLACGEACGTGSDRECESVDRLNFPG